MSLDHSIEEEYYRMEQDKRERKNIQEFITLNIHSEQTNLVRDAIKIGLFDFIEPENISNWFAISDSFALKLRKLKQPLLWNPYGTWWGRTRNGPLPMDSVIADIVKERN